MEKSSELEIVIWEEYLDSYKNGYSKVFEIAESEYDIKNSE